MKTKAIIVIITTLLIGFMLGMLTSAQIRHSKLRKMRSSFSGRDFAEMMMNTINPDNEQRAKLEEVMKNYEKITREMQSDFRKDFDSVSSSFRKDIDTLLTPEQLARVKELDARNREMMKKMNRDRRYWHDERNMHRPQPDDPHSRPPSN